MKEPRASTPFVISAIVAMLVGRQIAAAPAPPATQPDWVAEFLADAPAEYARLEKTVARWEMNYVVTDTYYSSDGSGRVVRQIVNRCRTVFDDRLGGIRSEVKTISPTTRPGALVCGLNPQYTFEVDRQGDAPYVMAQFAPRPATENLRKRWIDQSENYRAFEAEEFAGASLMRSMQGGQVRITSASTIDLNGKSCVRFECERVIKSSPRPGPYPGSAVVDPSFRWAVRSYDDGIPGGTLRRVSIEYNPTVTEVAFPKRIVQEDLGRNGKPWMRTAMEFDDPKPSHAVAEDFTLEAFGLAAPHPTVVQVGPNHTFPWIYGIFLLALVLFAAVAAYRRAKQRREANRARNRYL